MPKSAKTKLNKPQMEAVEHETGPLLVVAGAGTGKTRVITERIRYLIEEKSVKPQEILALTFTEKASQEMLERIGDVMPLGYEEPWVYTFHSFTDRLLRKEGLEIGLDPTYKIIPDASQWLLLRKNLFKLRLDYFRPLGNPTKFISAILKFISRLQDENISPEEYAKFANEYSGDETEKTRWLELAEVYTKYTELKLEDSKLDFGDLISHAIRLFQTRQNILSKYKTQFKHVLVDEFQDTNYAQYELIKLLFTEIDTNRSLVVVGDDSQSIYKFRGAAVSNILQFMQDYPKAKMLTLLENYRSSQEILDPAYKLIQNNNPDTLESKLGISKELKSQADIPSIKPQIIEAESEDEEVETIVAKIYEILGKEPQYTYRDFAVLARSNNHLESIVLALRKYAIPYQLVNNRGLYDRDEIADVMAFLKVLVNPNDGVNLYRILNIPTLEIKYQDVTQLLTQAKYKKISLWETAKESTVQEISTFLEKIDHLQQQMTKVLPSELVYELVYSINYLDQFTEEETVENQLCIKNLDLFLKRVKKFETEFYEDNRNTPTTNDLIDYLELIVEAGENPAQAEIEDIDTVNLMTVHASKGLEFPVVFMPFLIAGRFPTRNRKDQIMIPEELIKETLPSGDEHIQEERRLFYVGMTRAQKYLFMSYAKDYGGKRDPIPSGFLGETEIKTQPAEKVEAQKQEFLFGKESGFRASPVIEPHKFVPYSLSYSQIDNYSTCPLKYKYAYILRIPTLPSAALTFGSTIHDTLRDYHTKRAFGEDVSLEELLEIYEDNWQPLGYLDAEHRDARFESGKLLLEKYYETNKGLDLKHVALEKNFNIKIDGIKFTGRIDRMDDLGNKKVEIIDYKTGKPQTQKDVDKDDQVTIYALAAKEAFGLDAEKLSLYFVESNEKITTSRTPEQLEQKKEDIAGVIAKMKEGAFEATPGMHCEWCDFKGICPKAHRS